jgi:hypothetical protein
VVRATQKPPARVAVFERGCRRFDAAVVCPGRYATGQKKWDSFELRSVQCWRSIGDRPSLTLVADARRNACFLEAQPALGLGLLAGSQFRLADANSQP